VKIKHFRDVFEAVMTKKGLILGGNNGFDSSYTSTEVSAWEDKNNNGDEDYSEIGSAKRSAVISRNELSQILRNKNKAELTAAAGEALKRGGRSLISVTSRLYIFSALIRFLI
jgi:hypothetical protein